MNDNQNVKNMKSLEEEEKEKEKEEENENKTQAIQTFPFAEIVVKKIIDKIISLVITNSIKNQIENRIPNYCFEELIQSIEVLAYLDLLTYDKDDLENKQKRNLKKFKSTLNLKINKNDFIINETDQTLNNSQIIRKYKFEKKFDPKNTDECSINIDTFNDDEKSEKKRNEKLEKDIMKEEKKVLGILVREKYKDKMTSFEREEEKKRKIIEDGNQKYNFNFDDKEKILRKICSSDLDPFQINSEEKIDIIKNVEIHKIELSPYNNKEKKKKIPLDTKVDSKNFWSIINQPKAPVIDRDAGTKIKYEKPKTLLRRKSINEIPEQNILEEDQNNQKKRNDNNSSKKKKSIKFSKKTENDKKNKKKKYIQMEFESTDIDPKHFESIYETEETAILREQLEQELKDKKLESEKIAKKEREKQAKIEALEELRKELSKKNVTTDVKGEIVFIKPLDIKALIDEFKKGKSNFKNIKTIETETNFPKTKRRFSVIKNPDMNIWDLKDEKNKKKMKKKIREMFASKSNKKNEQQKPVFDRNSLKYAAGSNFKIMNPEVGVSIIEDKKVKSGGKDFFKKFNKFSLEIFQDQLSKTASTTFFPKITDQNENNNINEKAKKRGSIFKQNAIKEIDPKLIEKQPHEDNNVLSLKTKNLKIALENLDLISEQREKELNSTNNKKLINKNVIKKTRNKLDQIKFDYNEMNVFAKTLMGTHNWGMEIYSERKKEFFHKMPKKPEGYELQRELPVNLLKHMPRKRLPPIAKVINTMGQTTTGFFSDRKPVKIKLALDENKNKIKEEENKQ